MKDELRSYVKGNGNVSFSHHRKGSHNSNYHGSRFDTMVKIRKSVPHEIAEESGINHAKKSVGTDYVTHRKNILSVHLKLFPIFKKNFNMQSSSTRMIPHSQRQKYSKYSSTLLWTTFKM